MSDASSAGGGPAGEPFEVSAEQAALRESVRRLMKDRSTETDVRRVMGTRERFDPELWQELAELGLLGLSVPERHGGAGCGYLELLVVLEEMGRALLCGPYYSTVALAVNALLALGDESAHDEFLPGIASGDTIATLAIGDRTGPWRREAIAVSAEPRSGRFVLNGRAAFVPDGQLANLLLVAARTPPDGVSLFAVDTSTPGLEREPLETLDLTRGQANLVFRDVVGRLVGPKDEGWPVLEKTLDLARVALAAEQVGGMQATFDMAVAYAKERVQFGRPIGSFQAVKHKCADMLLLVESATSAASYGAWVAATASPELPVVACLAQAYCSDAFVDVATESIHVHGGIGFTWEHPAHLYFRRAKASEALFGGSREHREALMQRLGI